MNRKSLDCIEKYRLLDVCRINCLEYAKEVASLVICVQTADGIGFDNIRAKSSTAFLRTRSSQLDLEQHMNEHGC